MKISEFDFNLPVALIAQRPLPNRDASRMLVIDDIGTKDDNFSNFINYLKEGDVVVFNNSRVMKCRFNAGEYEFTLHTKQNDFWWAFTKKFNKLKIGNKLKLIDGTEIIVRDKSDESGVLIEFLCENVFTILEKVGKMPLPPYIKHDADSEDFERYQTIYADLIGSMAAPTAGLHFTDKMIAEIEARAKIVNITLHVGAGTWMPIKIANIKDHKMHSEFGVITKEQADIINSATRVIAIGTTTLRLLETAASGEKLVRPFNGTTDIFITPGYKFKIVDVLLTNFHLPKSTLFILVCAFAGIKMMKAAYQHAILEKYRFFSYGDCCLIFKNKQLGAGLND